jgi:ATP-grasp domain
MCENFPNLRILVVATNKWPSVGRLVSALIKVGFEVAVVCPAGSPIRFIKNLGARYEYRSWSSLTSIKTAITDWSPILLVCNDNLAICELHEIHRQASVEINTPESPYLIKLIESSLGDRRLFSVSLSKSRLMLAAEELGIRCPSTIVVSNYDDIDRQLDGIVFPVLVKLDESWGGLGVRLAHNKQELLLAVLELSFPHQWPQSLKRLVARIIQHLPDRCRLALPKNINIQKYIGGRPASRSVICWHGTVLAGISVEAAETDSQFGPITLAKILHHPTLAEAAEKIVASQKLSGFLGFDFMLDDADKAWFLEMNARATPTCHLRSRAPSLPASLFFKIKGERPVSDVREVPRDILAVFPNRVSQQSVYPYFDDVPEDEPEFVNACRKSRRFRKMLRGRSRSKTYGNPSRIANAAQSGEPRSNES